MDFPEVTGPISGLTNCLFSKAFQTVISIYRMFFNSNCFTNLHNCFLVLVDMFGQIVSSFNMLCLILITMLA